MPTAVAAIGAPALFAGGAALTGAVGTGILASRASTKAAGIGAAGAERSGAQIQAAADRARGDVLDFFPAAQQDLLAGAGAAGDLLVGGIGEQQRLLSAGNVGAQGTLQTGFGQVQNALLGLPVNQQAFAPQAIQLSQPLVNPLAQQTAQGQPAQGLFSQVGQVQQKAQQQRLEGVTSNADVLNKIVSGEFTIPGVDANRINEILSAPRAEGDTFLSKGQLVELARTGSSQDIERFLSGTGLNDENRSQFRQIIASLSQQFGGQ